MSSTVLICRTCGARLTVTLAVNEQELANVGMLERRCTACARDTTWGLLEDYRKRERRAGERRAVQRRARHASPPSSASERRRTSDRRVGDMRRLQRRKG